jgi:hypothetical protein
VKIEVNIAREFVGEFAEYSFVQRKKQSPWQGIFRACVNTATFAHFCNAAMTIRYYIFLLIMACGPLPFRENSSPENASAMPDQNTCKVQLFVVSFPC